MKLSLDVKYNFTEMYFLFLMLFVVALVLLPFALFVAFRWKFYGYAHRSSLFLSSSQDISQVFVFDSEMK